MSSFARYAPPHARLLVKRHPLDDGLVDWARVTRRTAARYGVAEQVTVIDGGDIESVGAMALVTIHGSIFGGANAASTNAGQISSGAALVASFLRSGSVSS